jgi:hypothetical protein
MTKKGDFGADYANPATSLNNGPLVQPGANGGGSRAYWHGVRIHRRCRDCKKGCKQSPKVLLIKCPQFEAK